MYEKASPPFCIQFAIENYKIGLELSWAYQGFSGTFKILAWPKLSDKKPGKTSCQIVPPPPPDNKIQTADGICIRNTQMGGFCKTRATVGWGPSENNDDRVDGVEGVSGPTLGNARRVAGRRKMHFRQSWARVTLSHNLENALIITIIEICCHKIWPKMCWCHIGSQSHQKQMLEYLSIIQGSPKTWTTLLKHFPTTFEYRATNTGQPLSPS